MTSRQDFHISQGRLTMTKVYLCQVYLTCGVSMMPWTGKIRVPKTNVAQLLEDLEFTTRGRSYNISYEKAWKYFSDNYKSQLSRLKILSMDELVYKSMSK